MLCSRFSHEDSHSTHQDLADNHRMVKNGYRDRVRSRSRHIRVALRNDGLRKPRRTMMTMLMNLDLDDAVAG